MRFANDSSTRAEWVQVASYPTGLEADIARSALELAEIPVLVRSDSPGIFGLAFQGVVAGGVRLHVPSPEVERAQAVLEEFRARHLSLVDDDEEFDEDMNARRA
jgi:Putative prokaryotic signal transducing protein